jgi:hypothetical protein
VRCHLHAFAAMAGIARELWYDNLATALAETTAICFDSIRASSLSLAKTASSHACLSLRSGPGRINIS